MSLGVAGRVAGYTWRPGANAGYRVGTNRLEANIAHFTAGAYGGDSAVGLRGYFNAYAPRAGHEPEQYAEIDATTWHACEWNARCTSLEVEKRTDVERMADQQVAACGLWVRRCAELGIPATYYDVPRSLQPGGPLPAGHISHRSLNASACDDHTDYWTADEWQRILAAANPTIEKEGGMAVIVGKNGATAEAWLTEGAVALHRFTGATNAFGVPLTAVAYADALGVPAVGVTDAELAAAKARAVPGSSGGGGLVLPADYFTKMVEAVRAGVNAAETS